MGFLARLESLWSSLPVAKKDEDVKVSAQARARMVAKGAQAARRGDRSNQDAAPQRSYHCDSEGWILEELATALARARALMSRGTDDRISTFNGSASDFHVPCD